MSEQEATAISRRRVVQGLAWATPAIVIATSAPAAAANSTDPAPPPPTCVESSNGSARAVTDLDWAVVSGALRNEYDTTGWTPANASNPDSITNDWFGIGATYGFMSMEDNALGNASTVVRARYTFDSVAGAIYRVAFASKVGFGQASDGTSARQSMVMSVASTAGTAELVKLSVMHGPNASHKTLPAGNSSDDQMVGLGYTLASPWTDNGASAWTPQFTAPGGMVTVSFTFTIEPVVASNAGYVSDDIWVGRPVVTQVGCA